MNTNPIQQTEQLKLFDNYGLWHVPFRQKTWFIVATLVFVCALIVALTYVYLRYKRSKKKVLSPTERALQDLQLLKKKGLNTIANSSTFYAGLTGILKTYLSMLFMQDVRSNTDQQMLDRIQKMPLFDAQKEGLSRIFSAGELIKFARLDALEDQMEQDWLFCYDFVHSALKKTVSSVK